MTVIRNESAQSEMADKVVSVLKTCFDPEIPVNIYEMGLIYTVDIDETNHVRIQMTLTSPMCPVAESLPPEVEMKVGAIEGVAGAQVGVTWEPPWTPDLMSDAAKLQLNMM